MGAGRNPALNQRKKNPQTGLFCMPVGGFAVIRLAWLRVVA